MDGSASRDGFDGSRLDGLGNGRLGIAQWIGRLAIGNGGLAMYWTARVGTSSAIDGSVSRDGLDGLQWDGSAMDGSASRDGLDGSQ